MAEADRVAGIARRRLARHDDRSCCCDWRCPCRKPHPAWSRSMLVLVKEAAESVGSMYVEAGDFVRIGDRFGERVQRAGVRDALVRPVLVIERLELAQGVQ